MGSNSFCLVTSKEYEMELESMNLENEKRIDELESENSKILKELDRL